MNEERPKMICPPPNFLKKYLEDLTHIFSLINPQEFEEFIRELNRALGKESRLFLCGNGGSAASASHFVCDLNKGVKPLIEKRFKAFCLCDNLALLTAYSNDISYESIFVEQLKNFLSADDLIIGISASGNSMNVIKAIEYGNDHGARTFGLCGFDGGKLRTIAQKSLLINSSDMQKVEDVHLIILHCVMQWFNQEG